MTTIGTAIASIRRDLRRSYKEPINSLQAAISSTSATTFTLTRSLNTIIADSVVEIDDELIYVLTVNTGGPSVTLCIRGFDGTTAATHLIGAVVRPNPRYATSDIRQAIAEEIRSWQPRLYRVATQAISLASGNNTRAWNFTGSADFLGGLIGAKLQPGSSADFGGRPIDILYHSIQPGQLSGSFASGWAYVLNHTDLPAGTLTVHYTAAFDLSSVADAVDLQSAVGIPASCDDLLRFGVLWRLVSAQEGQRSDSSMQDTPRRSEEVKAGDAIRTAAAYKSLHDERLSEEAAKLIAKYGMPSW